MSGLLRQTVKTVRKPKSHRNSNSAENAYSPLFNLNSLYSCAGTGGMGNYESIESVVSGHFGVLLLLSRKDLRQQPKGTNSPKAICAIAVSCLVSEPT
jgi:hypothetical protein